MHFQKALLTLAASAALFSLSAPSDACFTIIVGKNLSETGDIMVAHNEDNENRVMSNQYWVPPATHKAGELIEFEPGTAKIPQVEKTNGFWWEQTLHPAGYAFSDGFFNDKGVLVTSNNCGVTIEKDEPVKDGGIGYGIRRLIAERATSAYDGVQLAIKLVGEYGYRHQGRTYTIADAKEAWQLALLKGGRYLARRVGPDEMTLISNAFSLGNVNLKDKANVIYSPDLVQHAIDKGTYKPAKAGDYSDFNFRTAYHLPSRIASDRNVFRVRQALERLTGRDFSTPYSHPEAMGLNPGRKISVEDLRDLLRQNNPWQRRESGWQHEVFTDISNQGTFNSAVYVLTKNPLLSYTWRTSGRPDSNFSYPQFLLGKPAEAQAYLTPEQALKAQFRSVPNDFDYSPDRTAFMFVNHQIALDWDRPALRKFGDLQRSYEEKAKDEFKIAQERARLLSSVDEDKTIEQMHQFNVESFDKVLGATASQVAQNYRITISIGEKTLKKGGEGTVKVTLFSQKDFDAQRIEKDKTFFGDGYPDDKIHRNSEIAPAGKIEFKDVDGDGLKDAVIKFSVKGATANTFPGVYTQLYLWTKVDGKSYIAMDTVNIEK